MPGKEALTSNLQTFCYGNFETQTPVSRKTTGYLNSIRFLIFQCVQNCNADVLQDAVAEGMYVKKWCPIRLSPFCESITRNYLSLNINLLKNIIFKVGRSGAYPMDQGRLGLPCTD
ncbi:unnamed protein product [Chondrus crispus]|uniref:Uncharacterized protein n=1 Tax=Chondrus crispus TaxID=2769 RepID=R7QI45_CHOCR|nr:unnamed protein product [Chondrus crispus]CDF37080.1 unnamed protein product [Chondrus crispus]|eukprot:XP_005716899.1 unnamed protein product [Chondrus crispus]